MSVTVVPATVASMLEIAVTEEDIKASFENGTLKMNNS